MSTESDDASRLELLLGDIRDAFAKEGGVEISSADVVKALVAIEGRPWAERGKNGKRGKPLTQKKLAQMLKPLAIAPDHLGSGASVRGYKLWQFEEAFLRHLPSGRGLSSRRVQELAEWCSHQAYWHYSKKAARYDEMAAPSKPAQKTARAVEGPRAGAAGNQARVHGERRRGADLDRDL
jgi:uncharacterized protein DUF3631